ncbi:MAG TPA: hypothetical protein PLK40_07275 [Bacteroidaceae bacterium]|nr:hypothetical protein [Bacteroidaceae bacterium]
MHKELSPYTFIVPDDYYQKYIDQQTLCEYNYSISGSRIYLHIAITWTDFCLFLVHINPQEDIVYFHLPYTPYWQYTCCKSTSKPTLRRYGFIKFHLHGKVLKIFKMPFVSASFVQDPLIDNSINAIRIGVRWRRIL